MAGMTPSATVMSRTSPAATWVGLVTIRLVSDSCTTANPRRSVASGSRARKRCSNPATSTLVNPRRLEEMVQALESGGLALAQSTALYEEGMGLVQRCNQLLNETELKITRLKDFYASSPDELDWDPEQE